MLKSPFNVVFDPFMTPTAVAVADIVLPTAMCCERNNARAWWFPVRATKKVTQYYEARTDEQVTVDLCNLLNPELMEREFGWKTDVDFVQWFLDGGDGIAMGASLEGGIADTLKGGIGMSFDELVGIGRLGLRRMEQPVREVCERPAAPRWQDGLQHHLGSRGAHAHDLHFLGIPEHPRPYRAP